VDIRTKLPFLIYDDFTPQRYEIEIDAKLLLKETFPDRPHPTRVGRLGAPGSAF
jgi:hypothetical protein